MSIEAGKPYKFVNKRAGLALHLSTKEQTSVIGEDVQPVIRQSVRMAMSLRQLLMRHSHYFSGS
jgi:hypothetical protein